MFKVQNHVQHVLEAIKQPGSEADVTKIEDIKEMMKYNVLIIPVLMIDNVIKIKGRVADISEIKKLLT